MVHFVECNEPGCKRTREYIVELEQQLKEFQTTASEQGKRLAEAGIKIFNQGQQLIEVRTNNVSLREQLGRVIEKTGVLP